MKLRYKKHKKFNYLGKQYKEGDILETDANVHFPENWFEPIEETEKSEMKEDIVELPKRKARKPKTEPKEEVIEDGNEQDTDEDLGS